MRQAPDPRFDPAGRVAAPPDDDPPDDDPPADDPPADDGLLGGEDDSEDEDDEPAPGATAWSEAERRASELVRRETGKVLSDHLLAALTGCPGARILAIGAGAGSAAVELLQRRRDSSLVCIDSDNEALQDGRKRGRELQVDARFVAVDLDAIELEPRAFDLVFCHATLYRTVELERMADQIRRALRSHGSLILVEVATRDGYAMWDDTRDVVQAIWKTLPAKFRLNHTAYTAPLIDDVIWEPDPAPSGRKLPRPQNILPVLDQRFSAEHFVAYFSLCRRFFDSMYGPNYDLAAPLDRATFNWIWQLDLHYLAIKRLRPETFFGIYRLR